MINGHFASQVARWEYEARTKMQAEDEKYRNDTAKDGDHWYTTTNAASNVSASQDRLPAVGKHLIRLISGGNSI